MIENNTKSDITLFWDSTTQWQDLDGVWGEYNPYIYTRIDNTEKSTGEIQTPLEKAYSFRQLRIAYEGSAFRVRRSSDDTEQDIGFVNGYTDIATFNSFIGGDTAYITTWYDQSGNGNHLVQTTHSNQPIIDTKLLGGNTRFYLNTQTGNHFLTRDGGAGYFNCNSYHEFNVAAKTDTAFSVLSGYADSGTSTARDIVPESASVRFRQNTVFNSASYPATSSTRTIYEMTRTASDQNPIGYLTVTGTTTTASSPTTASTTPRRYWFLASGSLAGSVYFNGEIYEHLTYTSTLSEEDQTKQRNDLLAFYSL